MNIPVKYIIIGIFIIFILVVGVLIFVSNSLYNFAINRNADRDINSERYSNMTAEEIAAEKERALNGWIKDNGKEVSINSSDGLKLIGYEVRNDKSDNYAIILHGYKGQAFRMSKYAEGLYDLGFNLLIPDLRGHGKSEGNYIGMGYKDSDDLIEWTNFILESHKDAKVIYMGASMGAGTVMIASSKKNLPKNVKLIIEDCGYTSAWDQFSAQLKERYKLRDFPVLYISSLISKIRAGYFFSEASPLEAVKKSSVPILFIHGDDDDFVQYYMHDVLYDAATCEKEKLVVHGAGHCRSKDIEPEIYWDTVSKFINKYI